MALIIVFLRMKISNLTFKVILHFKNDCAGWSRFSLLPPIHTVKECKKETVHTLAVCILLSYNNKRQQNSLRSTSPLSGKATPLIFTFASLLTQCMVNSKRKEFAPLAANSFLLELTRVTPFRKGFMVQGRKQEVALIFFF